MALAAWGAELALITLRDLNVSPPGITWRSSGNRISGLPAPGDYLATFILFAPLAVMADTQAKPVADLLGWAFVLATLFNLIDPSQPLSGRPKAATPSPSAGHAGPNPQPQGAQ